MKVPDPRSELAELATSLRERLRATDESELPPVAASPAAAGRPTDPASDSAARGCVPAPAEMARAAVDLEDLRREVLACRKCPLGSQRLNPAFGVGSTRAAVMFIGEGPGYEEDRKGEPFVGKAGQLLDKILASIGLSRQTVYIANVVKCHPMVDPTTPDARGNDRPPTPAEMAACRAYLEEQIRRIHPRILVALGSVAAKALLGEDIRITKVRGQWREYRLEGIEEPLRLLPTFHPAALLRDPNLKRDVWTDMKNLRQELERPS